MIQALALLFIPIGMFLTISLEIFGPQINMNEVTIAGGALSLLLAILLYCVRTYKVRLFMREEKRIAWMSLAFNILVFIFLAYVTFKNGLSPTLAFLFTDTVPLDMLNGVYRNLVPLRALVPPLVMIQSFFILFVLPYRRTPWNLFIKGMMLFTLIAVCLICETRHIILWQFLYLIVWKIPSVARLRSIFIPKYLIRVVILGTLIWGVFVAVGNIRSGVDATAEGAQHLASGMALSPEYWDLPSAAVWAVIYLFSGFARGIDNDLNIEMLHLELDSRMFPGFLQFIPHDLGLEVIRHGDRFSVQYMAIDGYHALCLSFGFLFGTVVFIGEVLAFAYLGCNLWKRGIDQRKIPLIMYAAFLWLGVRILLLPIGDYLMDFGAWMELVWIYMFMKAADMDVVRADE